MGWYNSYKCFNERDKAVLYSYALVEERMMKDANNSNIMAKLGTKYMILFNDLLDIEHRYALNGLYKHIERSMTMCFF